jgi:hypothetical protein
MKQLTMRVKIQERLTQASRSQGMGVPLQLWVGVTQSGRSPAIWIPMKRDPEDCEAKGRGLEQKYQAR